MIKSTIAILITDNFQVEVEILKQCFYEIGNPSHVILFESNQTLKNYKYLIDSYISVKLQKNENYYYDHTLLIINKKINISDIDIYYKFSKFILWSPLEIKFIYVDRINYNFFNIK